jgi:uncharacterized protein (TIGR02996 family)
VSDGPLLLRAILEAPAEDTPRLVYADWLDENGQPERAEFIRVQCELPRLVKEPHFHDKRCPRHGLYRTKHRTKFTECRECAKCRHRWLTLRERELWKFTPDEDYARYRPYCWFPDLDETTLSLAWENPRRVFWYSDNGGGPRIEGEVGRGFISRVELPAADFLAHAEAIFRAHPVTGITLVDRMHPYPAHGGRWTWWNAEYSTYWSAGVPYPLFGNFPDADGGEWHWHDDGYCVSRSWPTSDLALTALSRACVAYGRKLARANLGVKLGVA